MKTFKKKISSTEDIEAKVSAKYQKVNIKSIPYSLIYSIFALF